MTTISSNDLLSPRELALVQLATHLALARPDDLARAQGTAQQQGIAAAQLARISAEVAALKAAPAAAAPSLSAMLAGAKSGCCS